MDTIYLKIKIRKTDTTAEELRNEGLFFENIANALSLEKEAIIEIDEINYRKTLTEIQKTFKEI